MANDRLRALEDVEKEIALVLQSAGLALHKCMHGFNFSTLMLDINLDTGSYSGIWIEIELALNHDEIVLNIIKHAELTSLLTKRSSNQSALSNNTSLLTDTFPTAFKQARVTPLLKKPTLNTSLTDSYRPVSLLPFIAKTLEQVVFNQLSSFLSKHNLLDAIQSGIRRGHSTETALLKVTEALRIAKADSISSGLILLDLSAAFDTVNH